MPHRIAIHGAAGRMGRRLIVLGHEDDQLELVAALESPRHPEFGNDAGIVAGIGSLGLPLSDAVAEKVDVMIDFSVAAAVPGIAQLCCNRRIPLVVATTGLDETTQENLRATAVSIPVVWAPNMSLAVNLTMKLAAMAAEALASQRENVDVEILERHHRYKEDAPSGTALEFGETIARIMGLTQAVHGRQGRPGKRSSDEIGYHAIRAGDHPGEHTVYFGMPGESVELSVRATSRDSYAIGALSAAKFVVGREPKLYSMADVLGL